MMMKAPLTKLLLLSFTFLAISSHANANWSVSNHSPINSFSFATSSSSSKSHFVQIFSSVNATKAEGMKNTLEMQGYPAFVRVGQKQPRPYYQVQIGPFISRQTAQQAKMSIIQLYPEFPFLNDAILKMNF
jgi:cell division septation protein DedD